MQKELKSLFFDRVHRYGILLSAFFIMIGTVAFLIKFWSLPPVIPIFYNRPWGVLQLGPPWTLFAIVGASILVLIFNLAFSLAVYRNGVLFSRILLWVSSLVSFLAAVTVIRVLFLTT